METALSRLGPYLLTLSDGETGMRAGWIGIPIRNMDAIPEIELASGSVGDFSSYDAVAQYRIKDGSTLSAEQIDACLPYHASYTASYPLFCELRDAHQRPDLPFQVGIPGHLDLSVDTFTFQDGFDPRYLGPCFEATLSQVRKIAAEGGDVVFQIETPAALISTIYAGDEGAAGAAAHMAADLVRLPAGAPEGTRFGVHLCLGDMNHKSYIGMRDVGPAVLLANAIAAAWPAGRPLEFIHMPFAAAEEPPTFDEAFYAPLRTLDIPGDVRFVAGCIHEALSAGQQADLLAMIEKQAGRQADVAAPCGLGRRPDEAQAWDAMDKALLLVSPATA